MRLLVKDYQINSTLFILKRYAILKHLNKILHYYKWTMVGWCLLRNDFRHFRLDRIGEYSILDETFTLSKEQSLQTFFSLVIPKS